MLSGIFLGIALTAAVALLVLIRIEVKPNQGEV